MQRVLADLGELLAIDSVGGTPAEAQAQHWVADTLRSWGWEVDVWTDDPQEYAEDPAFPGMEVPRSSVTGVIGRPRGSRGSRLILGHTRPGIRRAHCLRTRVRRHEERLGGRHARRPHSGG